MSRCRQGALFDGYLKITERCDVCGSNSAATTPAMRRGRRDIYSRIWHRRNGCVLEWFMAPPLWLHALLWLPLTLIGTLVLLRPLKGLTVALQYRFRSVDEPERAQVEPSEN